LHVCLLQFAWSLAVGTPDRTF